MNLLTLLESLPEELRHAILLEAGPKAAASLALTSQAANTLVRLDVRLWKRFAEPLIKNWRDGMPAYLAYDPDSWPSALDWFRCIKSSSDDGCDQCGYADCHSGNHW